MSYIETVKWRTYDYDRDVFSRFSATHIYDGSMKTRCGTSIPDSVKHEHFFDRAESQPITCKLCLAKHEVA